MATLVTPLTISLFTSGIVSFIAYLFQSQKYFEKINKLEDLQISEKLSNLGERISKIEGKLELINNNLERLLNLRSG